VTRHLTDTERMVLTWHGDVVGNIPIPPLVTEAPMTSAVDADRAAARVMPRRCRRRRTGTPRCSP